jgi:hypothetical protein
VVILAGLPFAFEPEAELTTAERDALRDLVRGEAEPESPPGQTPFRVVLHRRAAEGPPQPPEAARVSWERDHCRLSHATFEAELDPALGEARVWRSAGSAVGLLTTLRTAICSRLPLEGGLVLHAAGLERQGSGLVFFGPSGAGKSTLAARSPWPIVSDELVAIVPGADGSFAIRGTPFRKPPPGPAGASRRPSRLRALVELDKGAFRLDALGRTEALRSLIASAAVPAGPPLWTAALAVIGRLVSEAPTYRMAWSLDEAPFDRLSRDLPF